VRSADDPGLARERTALSWQRTAIAFAGVAGLMLLRAFSGTAPWVLALAAAVPLAAAAGAARHGRAAYAQRLSGIVAPARGPLRAVALVTVVAALAAAALAPFD
jgi:uncharacterized membrane protein YidH (DUF202 family)